MMTLTTVSKKTSNNSALVFWRVGTKRKGILDVRIDFDNEEADLLAELVAIRYLALDKQVFAESQVLVLVTSWWYPKVRLKAGAGQIHQGVCIQVCGLPHWTFKGRYY